MSKQEEVIQIIVDYCWWLDVDVLTKEQLREDIKGDLIPKLDNKDVVIKVDRELPEVETFCELAQVECIPKLTVQQDMLKADYVAVEPLIE